MFFKVNIKLNQRSRLSQIHRYEILEALLDQMDRDDPKYTEFYGVWKRDKVWDIRLTDAEIDMVCDDHYVEAKYAYIDQYAKVHGIPLTHRY